LSLRSALDDILAALTGQLLDLSAAKPGGKSPEIVFGRSPRIILGATSLKRDDEQIGGVLRSRIMGVSLDEARESRGRSAIRTGIESRHRRSEVARRVFRR
jgi:hypothetical protein